MHLTVSSHTAPAVPLFHCKIPQTAELESVPAAFVLSVSTHVNPSYSVVMQEFTNCINDHNESESFQRISSIPACLCEIFKARIFEIRYLIVHLALSVRYLLEIRRQSTILGHA